MNTQQQELTLAEAISLFDALIQQALKMELSNFDLQNLEKIKNRLVKSYMKKSSVSK